MAGGESVLCEAARNRNLEQVRDWKYLTKLNSWIFSFFSGQAASGLWGQCEPSWQTWRNTFDHCIMSWIYWGRNPCCICWFLKEWLDWCFKAIKRKKYCEWFSSWFLTEETEYQKPTYLYGLFPFWHYTE